ncbi:homoserine O-acetyltransferase family protein [Puia sp.]|jgi:homoserine O-acetyltransferase|uniref:homoserine O-acetyltransferase family protein n=1 Tax=Puia sp. TaxID=2045100 RepID=UPI002F4164E7
MNYLRLDQPFALEAGGSLPGITIAYHTYGRLNADGSNVVWVCHALTANSDVARWWPGVIGEEGAIRPEEYFIVCANILGSCYGSSGPVGAGPGVGEHGVGRQEAGDGGGKSGTAGDVAGNAAGDAGVGATLYSDFPAITIRDMVRAHIALREHLGIGRIHLLMGGSMGGYQALEWAVMEPERVGQLFLIATSPTESAWGIAVHTAQRLAIEADSSWREARSDAGQKGLKAARAIGILTYRNYGIMVQKQTDPDVQKLDGFRASSYIEYQGTKLVERFNAYCYWLLTKAMDSHNVARGRDGAGETAGAATGEAEATGAATVETRNGDVEAVLQGITQRTLVIGITSDILCPFEEQRHMAAHLPNAQLIEIDSAYGHDGFMVEGNKIASHLRDWLSK